METIELTDTQVARYFHRCYIAADGLWFMKVEEKYGFDAALDIDNEVWKVLPKIQARMLKPMVRVEGMDALFECLTTKLALEGFEFKAEKDTNNLRITISRCPWHELMLKSGREALSERVGTLICTTEYGVWCSEFDEDVHFELKSQMCRGSECCILQFSR